MRSYSTVLLLWPVTALGADLLVSHFSGYVYSLSLQPAASDCEDASLNITHSVKTGGAMPSWVTLDEETRMLYITDEDAYTNPVLTSAEVGSDNSLTNIIAPPETGGGVHCNLFGGSDGKGYLAEAEYSFSTISTYKLPLTSSTPLQQRLAFTMSGPGPVPSRQDAPHPHSVFTDPTGQFLLSGDLGADLIRIFSINASSGALTACNPTSSNPGDGPRHGEFWISSTNQTMLYMVNELANSVTTYQVNYPTASGGCLSLTKQNSLSAYPAGVTAPSGSKSAELHIKGNFVYISNRGDKTYDQTNDSAATYSIDTSTGELTFVEQTNTYVYFPRTFAINKAGDMVAFGGQTSSTVAVVERDVTTGRLGDFIAVAAVGPPGTDGGEDGLSGVVWND